MESKKTKRSLSGTSQVAQMVRMASCAHPDTGQDVGNDNDMAPDGRAQRGILDMLLRGWMGLELSPN